MRLSLIIGAVGLAAVVYASRPRPVDLVHQARVARQTAVAQRCEALTAGRCEPTFDHDYNVIIPKDCTYDTTIGVYLACVNAGLDALATEDQR